MYALALDTPNSSAHPLFPCESWEEAVAKVKEAIDNGYLDAGAGVSIVTGPGSIYKIMSEEQQEDPPKNEKEFCLIVQVSGGQIPPLGFDSAESMEFAVDEALADGVLRHEGRENHEYTFIQVCPGTVFMQMTREAFMDKQRMMLAEHIRKQQAEADADKSNKGGLIIMGN